LDDILELNTAREYWKMKSVIQFIIAGSIMVNMVGCATITTDTFQAVQVTTVDQSDQDVQDANCVLNNTRGEWHLKTQGSVSVHKSADNLLVKCSKDGMNDGLGTLISRANGGMWGNILIGGGIGALIDHAKGTAYNYPSWIKIVMGKNLAYDRTAQEDDQALAGKAMTEKELAEIEKAKAEQEKEIAKAENAEKDS
jgi:hypothetical protein